MSDGIAVNPREDEIQQIYDAISRGTRNALFPEKDEYGNPSLNRFVVDNGRLPFIADPVKPWAYRGHIVPYIQLCELASDQISPRYEYVARTVEAGKLLDDALPQCTFVGEGSNEAKPGMKMLLDMIKIAEYKHGFHQAVQIVCDWLGFGLNVKESPSDLPDEDEERLYRLFDVSKWLLAPTDYLGQQMAEAGHGKAAGFFPTPMSICNFITQASFGHAEGDNRTKTVNDPCVGTGRFLLAASNYSLRLSGMDINQLCVLVSKINLAMFAPWHLIPSSYFPEQQQTSGVDQGNALLAIPKAADPIPTGGQPSLF